MHVSIKVILGAAAGAVAMRALEAWAAGVPVLDALRRWPEPVVRPRCLCQQGTDVTPLEPARRSRLLRN